MAVVFIVALAFLTVMVSIRPVRIGRFSLDMATGSIITLVILFVFKIITPEIVQQGIIGSGTIRPW